MSHRNIGRALTGVGLVWLLNGCATLTVEQCKTINPQTQGYADGQAGNTTDGLKNILSDCQSNHVLTDVAQFKNDYLTGYQKGIAEYCTPQNGARVGLLGQEYQGVCPKESEAPFLKEYLYALKQYNDAHPQANPYYRGYFWWGSPFYDPFWGPWYYGSPHRHIHGFVRGGW